MAQLILLLSKYRNSLLLLLLFSLAVLRNAVKNPTAEHWMNSVGFEWSASVQSNLNSWKHFFNLPRINEELARENSAMRAAMKEASAPFIGQGSNYNYIPALVSHYSFNKPNNFLVVQAGSVHGVAKGMGVITPEGWVGTVHDVSAHYASIIPIIHTRGGMGGRLGSGAYGQITWSGRSAETIDFIDVPREHKPLEGDTIYSFTPIEVGPAVPIGTVLKTVQNQENGSWKSSVAMATDFSALHWVYICSFKDTTELNTLELP